MHEHFLTPENTSTIITIAMRHPIIGAITAVTLSAGGYFIPLLIEPTIPILYMQVIQIGVWLLAATASILVIVGYFKKHKKD
jgi:hypothetical protein